VSAKFRARYGVSLWVVHYWIPTVGIVTAVQTQNRIRYMQSQSMTIDDRRLRKWVANSGHLPSFIPNTNCMRCLMRGPSGMPRFARPAGRLRDSHPTHRLRLVSAPGAVVLRSSGQRAFKDSPGSCLTVIPSMAGRSLVAQPPRPTQASILPGPQIASMRCSVDCRAFRVRPSP